MTKILRVIEARQGDTADIIARREMGLERRGNTEALYALNPGLAALGPVLPMGTEVRIPDRTATEPETTLVRLWD